MERPFLYLQEKNVIGELTGRCITSEVGEALLEGLRGVGVLFFFFKGRCRGEVQGTPRKTSFLPRGGGEQDGHTPSPATSESVWDKHSPARRPPTRPPPGPPRPGSAGGPWPGHSS